MAVINVSGGGTSKLLIIGVIIAVIGLILFIRKNPNFLSNLLGGKLGAAVGGDTSTGWDVYKTTGNLFTPEHRVDQEIGCNNGTATQRDNHNGWNATNYEATAIIRLQAGDTCNCSTGFNVKILGPIITSLSCI